MTPDPSETVQEPLDSDLSLLRQDAATLILALAALVNTTVLVEEAFDPDRIQRVSKILRLFSQALAKTIPPLTIMEEEEKEDEADAD